MFSTLMVWATQMQNTRRIVTLMALLLGGIMACDDRAPAEVSSKHPDKVLFRWAMSAVQQNRFDVVRLCLHTLVNTYPNSKYARKAKRLLQDPRIANCGEGWRNLPDDFVTAPPTAH
jgi:hypothetical protein